MSRPGLLARVLAAVVVGYQRVLSPLLAPRCRFEPSCSRYAHGVLLEHGALRGGRLAVWRLLRCQPFGTPGYDPVPPRRAADDTRPDRRAAAALRGAGPC